LALRRAITQGAWALSFRNLTMMRTLSLDPVEMARRYRCVTTMLDRIPMKTSSIALAAALTLAACGQPNDSKAQDGVFADNRVIPGDATSMKASFAPVVRSAAPAVVNISAQGVQQVQDPFWSMFGQGTRRQQVGSVGSGVIVRPDGVVVTNFHVIQGMQRITVVLNDRREFEARVVLADERSDIAVLQLEGVN
jgi:S1-C subfamily serine protease